MRTYLTITMICLILPAMTMGAEMNMFNNGFDLEAISDPGANPATDHLWIYTKLSGGTPALYIEDDTGSVTGVTALAPTTDLTFEGSTANDHEAVIRATDPTSDTVWILPVAAAGSYSIMSSTLATNAPAVANSVTGGTSQLIFEGGTADAHEAIITATDPTSDTIWTLPVVAAGTYGLMSSTLATNGLDIANSVYGGTNQLIMEGATADAHELIFTPTDPTGDRTITWADASGVPVLSAAIPDGAHAISFGNSTIVMEGTTADAHEAVIDCADPTADTIFRLPVAAAGTYGIMSSSLATNAVDVVNSVTGGTNSLVFEGATADAHEITVSPSDPGADYTVTIPARTGTITLDTQTVGNYADEASPVTTTCGSVWTNATADGACVFNLPEASTVIGQSITFAVSAAQNLDVNPADADVLLLAASSAGDAIRCAVPGSTVTLMAVDAVNWVQVSFVGTWADVN